MFLQSFVAREIFIVLLGFGFYAFGIAITALFFKWLLKINEFMSIQKQILHELKVMNGKQDSL